LQLAFPSSSMAFGFSNIRFGLSEHNWHLACLTSD